MLKAYAGRLLQKMEGAKEVINQIEVLPPSANDDRLRLAVYRAVYGHQALVPYATRVVPPIHIIVKNSDAGRVGSYRGGQEHRWNSGQERPGRTLSHHQATSRQHIGD